MVSLAINRYRLNLIGDMNVNLFEHRTSLNGALCLSMSLDCGNV